MHEAEFDQKGQEENIWEQVLEELGEPQSIGKNEMEIRAGDSQSLPTPLPLEPSSFFDFFHTE